MEEPPPQQLSSSEHSSSSDLRLGPRVKTGLDLLQPPGPVQLQHLLVHGADQLLQELQCPTQSLRLLLTACRRSQVRGYYKSEVRGYYRSQVRDYYRSEVRGYHRSGVIRERLLQVRGYYRSKVRGYHRSEVIRGQRLPLVLSRILWIRTGYFVIRCVTSRMHSWTP